MVAKGNPQWPQAFYPMQNIIRISRGDLLFARCTYNSSEKDTVTQVGSTSNDEMCNLYLMYYSPNPLMISNNPIQERQSQALYSQRQLGYQEVCEGPQLQSLLYVLPSGNDVQLPRNVTLEESAKGQNSIHHSANQHHRHFDAAATNGRTAVNPNKPFKMTQKSDWPFGARMFGQVTAIDVDEKDNIVIFHRGKHVWNGLSFDMANNYRLINQGPIPDATIVTINPDTQQLIDQWGSGLFYLPHGLTIDRENKSVWLTDVAMHQVFKFSLDPQSSNYRKPLITLGERFVPGSDMKHFCKPTSVAIDYTSGDFYVADGYCNSRIMRFDKNGLFKNHWGHPAAYNGKGGFCCLVFS